MNTLKVMAAGWLIGAGVLIALSGDGRVWRAGGGAVVRNGATVPNPAEVRAGAVRNVDDVREAASLLVGDIVIPVAGISADQLRDTFDELRGGGNRVHRAMDILAPQGTPVLAAVDGTVRKLFDSRAGGITLYQFDVPQETLYYYAHLDRYAEGVREGLFVKRGTVIGYVGTTGNAGATPHLHFSIERLPPSKEWWKGEPVNPYPILRSAR